MLKNSTLAFAFSPLRARSPNPKSPPGMNEATIPAATYFPARRSFREKLWAFTLLLVDFAQALRHISQDYLHEENWLPLIRPLDTFAAVISTVGG
jgi:hypothetical protein